MLNAKLDLMPESAPSLRSHILVANHEMRPLAAGALYWEAEDTLLVADLHFEKGAAFAALGMLLPPYDTRTTLERLHKVISAVEPSRIVALGDSFHRSDLAESLAEDDLAMLTRLQQGREWYWICGNHDPAPDFAGRVADTVSLGPLTFRHAPSPGKMPGEVAGHLHPSAAISVRGHAMRRRCFAADGERLVLPAFGAYAGGLSIRDAAFAKIFQATALMAHVLGDVRLHTIAASRCY